MVAHFNMEGLLKAVEDKDADRVLSHFADQVTVENETLPETITFDKQALSDLLEEALPAIRDAHLTTKYLVQEGDQVAALLHYHYTFTRNYKLFDQELPVAGKALENDAAFFATLDDQGRIRHAARVQNLVPLLTQLGITPDQLQNLAERAADQYTA